MHNAVILVGGGVCDGMDVVVMERGERMKRWRDGGGGGGRREG